MSEPSRAIGTRRTHARLRLISAATCTGLAAVEVNIDGTNLQTVVTNVQEMFGLTFTPGP